MPNKYLSFHCSIHHPTTAQKPCRQREEGGREGESESERGGERERELTLPRTPQ